MQISPSSGLALALLCAVNVRTAQAKDEPTSLAQCPAPVQAVIRQYAAQGQFESVAKDEKKKTGGSVVYEAKFTLKDGRRIEVHMTAEGTVTLVEEKKRKS